ncbi:MAG: creatininase family protein [Acidobacteriota bacterium]|nr:creatininase family protein [Acidobacteriota bacterium]
MLCVRSNETRPCLVTPVPDPGIRFWQTLTTEEAAALTTRDPVIVLPVAAIEQHGPHLPLSTDLDVGLGLLGEAMRRLPDMFPVWALPPQAIGTSVEHTRFAGTLSLEPELLAETVVQLGAAVAGTGIRRLLVWNAHGGNQATIDVAALRLRREHGLLVVKTSYFGVPRPKHAELPDLEWRHGLHGGAVETGMMRHLRPELVRTDLLRRFASVEEELASAMNLVRADGPVSFAWLADDLNPEGVVGNARLGTKELGAQLVSHYGRVLADVIRDTRAFPLDRLG